jgi:hypothetical protein
MIWTTAPIFELSCPRSLMRGAARDAVDDLTELAHGHIRLVRIATGGLSTGGHVLDRLSDVQDGSAG